jgi:hypothetical protein
MQGMEDTTFIRADREPAVKITKQIKFRLELF